MNYKRLHYDAARLPQIVADEHPEWVEMYDRAWRIAFANIEYFDGTTWKPQMTCMPGMGRTWQWDSCFMTFIANYSNGEIEAMNNVDNLLSQQEPDGFISMCYFSGKGGAVYGKRINPPLYAWAEWEHYRVTGDDSRLSTVFPMLIRYYRWIKENRRRANGLYWFEDTGSSGMDNAPRSGYFAEQLKGSDVCFIDLACQQVLSATCLALIANRLGEELIRKELESESTALKLLINERHWSERFGFYYDLFDRFEEPAALAKFIPAKTAAAFWTVLSGTADERKIARLCEHLQNPAEFMTLHPVATLSKDDPNFQPLGNYWTGSVWPPLNFMIAKGLKRASRGHIARDIAVRHLNAMIEVARNETYAGIWECYAPDVLTPGCREDGEVVRNEFVGWSGLGPVCMLIENILGFDFDASRNTVHWTLGTKGRHGIRNFRFGNESVSLVCEKLSPVPGETSISVDSSGNFTLVVDFFGKSKDVRTELAVKAGSQRFKI